MSPPKVFISATSADLHSARQAIKEALLTIGCHPVEQTTFPPDWRQVDRMLRERISDCQALIHLVGMRYGAEPDPATLSPGKPRRSYTQMEYDIGRELQAKRGERRFRVYTFVCDEDFPYDVAPETEPDEKQALQQQHRTRILEGARLYEKVSEPDALRQRVLAIREKVLQLKKMQDRRILATLVGVVLIALSLTGIGYGVYRSYQDLPGQMAEQVAQQLDPEAVATRLRREIQTRFEKEAEAARAEGKNWEVLRELERRRDAALGRVDDVISTIKEGLAGKPSPVFVEASRILEREGVDAAIAYLESHQSDQLARVERAAAQVEAAQQGLQRELRPLILQAELHQIRLEWDQALKLLQTVTDKAPQWFEARNSLGVLLFTLARYKEAEPHMRAAARLAKPSEEATALSNLATLLQDTNRLEEAEPLMRRALAIDEANYGLERPDVARDLNNLAQLLQATNRLGEAEPLMRRALAIDESSYGPEHPDVARDLNNLAGLLQATNRLGEAEPLMRRALAIDEVSYGSEHPNVARDLNNLALLLQVTNRLEEAEPLMRRALAIDEASYGPEHPNMARDLNNLALLLKATNRLEEAEPLMRRALAILEASYGTKHTKVAIELNNLAQLLQDTNRLEEAEPLMHRALAIDEASYGPEHPNVARDLNNLAQLLKATDRLEEAEPLMRRALVIDEASYVPEHPHVARDLNNLARLLQATNRLEEAEPLMKRALEVFVLFTVRTGHQHPHLVDTLDNYASLLVAMGKDEKALQAEIEALIESVNARVNPSTKQPDH
jgi:tetratricopeptide (TPR) repeat protein